ncbi:MAG: AAA family ATPase [Pseudomonadota bacterium]
MKLAEFAIQNFKGIQDLEIELLTRIPGNIVTLIGLNESGKTTILEAMSHFLSVDEDTSSIVGTVSNQDSVIDLLPMSKKGNFSGEIKISCRVVLDEEDVIGLSEYLKSMKSYILLIDDCPRELTVDRVFEFKDGDHIDTNTLWDFSPKFLKKKSGNEYTASGNDSKTSETWEIVTDFIADRFPKIVYFPTFLFNVPERIYLEDLKDWEKSEDANINNYFRQVLQDVADSLDDGLSIDRHIVEKIGNYILHKTGSESYRCQRQAGAIWKPRSLRSLTYASGAKASL